MKKFAAILLAAAMVLAMAACGTQTQTPSNNDPAPASTTDTTPSQATEPTPAQTIDWPKRTITINVGFKAGGDTDYYARMMAQYMKDILGEDVIIVNTAGVNGQVAARDVLASDPDGYNCYFSHTVSLWQEACGMVDDFSYVDDFVLGGTIVADRTFAFTVSSRLGVKTMDELVAYAQAHPGEIKQASSFGGLGEYVGLQWKNQCNVETKLVDVGSSVSDSITAMLNGSLDMYCTNYSNVADYVETGEFVVIGLASEERCEYLPDIPTLREQGYDILATKYYYVNWPKGTDQAIVDKFNDAMRQVSEMPEFKEAVANFNGEVMYMTPAEHEAFAKDLVASMKALYEEMG